MLTPTANAGNLLAVDRQGIVRQLDLTQLDFFVLTLPDTAVCNAVTTLNADTAVVVRAELNGLRYADSNDSLFTSQWGLHNTGQFFGTAGIDIGAPTMWELASSSPIDVVVLDSGMDFSHPEFGNRLIAGPNEVAAGPPNDDTGDSHGTSVAGIIAAARGNVSGTAGINPTARIVVVKVSDSGGSVNAARTAAGIDWARVNGYTVANMSFSGPLANSGEATAMKNAWVANMSLFAASGNDNQNVIQYPAGYPRTVTAVGACYVDGYRWDDDAIPWQANWVTCPPKADAAGVSILR